MPPKMMNGGTAHPVAPTPWITVTHSRLPCCTVFGRPRRSDPVTTALVDITLIICKQGLLQCLLICCTVISSHLTLLHTHNTSHHIISHTPPTCLHYKARLAEVVGVFVLDPILGFGILHELEPRSDKLRIVAQGSLIILLPIELNLELRQTLDEVASPVYANRGLTTLRAQRISHCGYISELGWEFLAYLSLVHAR